jgi:hypothetical protein
VLRLRRLWLGWLMGWATILEGVCMVLSCGAWLPVFTRSIDNRWFALVERQTTADKETCQ